MESLNLSRRTEEELDQLQHQKGMNSHVQYYQ